VPDQLLALADEVIE